MTQAAEIRLDDRAGAAVLHVLSDLDVSAAPLLKQTLAEALDRHADVVIDLSQAGTVDSAGLGVLVRAHRLARRRGGTVCLAHPSRFLLTVLHTMHVDGVFPIFDDRAAALDWLRDDADHDDGDADHDDADNDDGDNDGLPPAPRS